jgi:hypothetical protein
MLVMGLDIGCSNLKIAVGNKDFMMEAKSLPASADNIDLMPRKLRGRASAGTDFTKSKSMVKNGRRVLSLIGCRGGSVNCTAIIDRQMCIGRFSMLRC